MSKIAFGFDFGTLSVRGIALDLETGREVATAEYAYKNGVISGTMKHKPISLPDGWFLQDPNDWIEGICRVSREMLKNGDICPEDVVSIGTDFTSCTLIPVKSDGVPLCNIEKYRDDPNSWPKLWKHHGAQKYAEKIEEYARENTTWLKKYFGNSVSSEWVFPKALQVAVESPDIYKEADYFIEAVDWIVMILTGNLTRTNGILGVNAFWNEETGYPDRKFCRDLYFGFEDFADKLSGKIVKVGDYVGDLTEVMANKMGLSPTTAVAAGHSDGAVAGCGAGVTESGSMMLVMGTSTCHQMMYKDFKSFEGICSIAADGMIPGLYGYESGQPATGDIFEWFSKNCVPKSYEKAALAENISLLEYLGELAENMLPGQTGLVALDWFNGNRSILSDYNLSGMIVGLTLDTKPEEIYRSLVEANVFGSKRILDNYEENDVVLSKIYAVGGLALKCPWIMQMCADVFGREVYVPQFGNVPARGAAVCGTVAINKKDALVGYKDFRAAAEKMIPKEVKIYRPDKNKTEMFGEVYKKYLEIHDVFGKNNSFMKELKELKIKALKRK